jgi:uncharacterized protein YmfQ (DUF2313 family)
MTHGADSYHAQLLALLPPGPAWPREPDSVLGKLLRAWADEFARVEARVEQLLSEYDPRTAVDLLDEWEAALGLPDPCTQANTNTSARQLNIWRKLAFVGGQTPAFFVALAASLGFEIEIHEFDPDVDDYDPTLASAVAAGRWRYVWRVHVLNAGDFTVFRAGDPVDGRLVEGDAAFDLECIFAAARPAHTHVIFSYPEE